MDDTGDRFPILRSQLTFVSPFPAALERESVPHATRLVAYRDVIQNIVERILLRDVGRTCGFEMLPLACEQARGVHGPISDDSHVSLRSLRCLYGFVAGFGRFGRR